MKLKPKMTLYTLLCALLCCVMLTGLLPTTALADGNETLTAGWTQSGTCEWKIDDGVLTIRPLGNGSEGTLADWSAGVGNSPWADNSGITSVVVKSGVKAVTCRRMFYGCRNLTSLDLSGLDTSNVTNMTMMFNSCSALTSLDLRSFDTSNVTSMSSMFYGCSALTSLDLRGFNTSKVTDMGYMFYGCSALTSLDLRTFDTGNLANMGYMFRDCSALTSLDLSSFNTSKLVNMGYMFYGDSALKELTLGANFNFKSASMLPDPSDAAPYTGKWTNGALSLTASQFTEQYNGSVAGTWVWEIKWLNGFFPAEDGCWYVYENNEVNTAVDKTLYFYNDAFFWIEKGKWNDRKHAFVEYSGAKFLVANGQAALKQNGLTQDPENGEIWYFCAAGQIQTQTNGLVMYEDEWFYVQNGKLDTTFAGYVDYDGSKFLVAAGRILKEENGLVQDPQSPADWYYVAGGQVATAYTGLALHSDQKHWFYIENGKLNADYTGPVEYNGQTFEVINGALPVPGEN